MNGIAPRILVIAVAVSLVVGGVAGFFLGIASSKAGKAFIRDIFEEERMAEVSHPKKLVRDKFELQYPSNWNVSVDDEDYDPDHLFSIESPGTAFVMFAIGTLEMEPEDNLQIQIREFEKLMGSPSMDRFESYGRLTGKGVTLKGKVMGIKTTAKLFAFHQDGLTVMITQQCPDEDLKCVQDGLTLIESSFTPRTKNEKGTPDKPDAGGGQ